MNEGHARLCSSQRWSEFIRDEVTAVVLAELDLSDRLLEIGPGYGAATAVLAADGRDLTAVEIDPILAQRLRQRFPTVAVVDGRGEDLPFPAASFAAVFSFTMLHHVQSPDQQDELFGQARRVLADGGVFSGSDSIASPGLREFHHDDTYTPVDPVTLADRLRAAGFEAVEVHIGAKDEWFWFTARSPRS